MTDKVVVAEVAIMIVLHNLQLHPTEIVIQLCFLQFVMHSLLTRHHFLLAVVR